MRVSLDTNVLHQEGYMSQSMRLLQRVINASSLQLVLSEIVFREYETKRIADLSAKAQSIKDNIREIAKIFSRSGEEVASLTDFDKEFTKVLPGLQNCLNETSERWLRDFKVSLLSPNPNIYEKVWDDYFSGKGAFKRLKNRDDIPDAIIGKSLEELIDDGKPLVFICKDGQLKEYMSKFPQVQVYAELNEFIRSAEFEKILSDLDARDMIIEEFKKVIGSETFLGNAMRYFSAKESDFHYSYWEDGMIENQSELPFAVWRGVSASGPIIASIQNVKYGQVSCVNPRHYVIPVVFDAYLPISFVGDYADWIHAPDEVKRSVEITSANGDGACEFLTTKRATVVGEIVVHLLEREEPKSLLIHSQYIGRDESPLDVEFVPNKIIL